MMQNKEKHLVLAQEVVLQTIGEEVVLLDLKTKQYFSLNPVGRRMLEVLTHEASIGQALATLAEEYAVEPDVLEADLEELIGKLARQGLVAIG